MNVAWKHNAGAAEDQREHLYQALVGYSRRLNADTVLVTDLIREQETMRHKEANIVELGVRRQLTPLTLVAVGLGAGIGDDSPPFRVTLGFQKSF